MDAVRAHERPDRVSVGMLWLRWLVAPALAALVVAVSWHNLRPSARSAASPAESLAAATRVFETGGRLAQSVPATVVAPLSEELRRLNQDLDSAAQYLLASLP
jgi:hypothetical protein